MGGIFDPIFESPEFVLARNLLSLFLVVLHVAIVFWVYRDADRRGAMAWFWALTTLLFPLAGLLVYLVARPPELLADARERELEIRAREVELQRDLTTCPSCHKPVEKEFLLCPYCMKKLRRPCIECGNPLRLNWGVCPYCKTKQ